MTTRLNDVHSLLNATVVARVVHPQTLEELQEVIAQEAAYPDFREFLRLKKLHDSAELFTSTWYAHYRDAFERHPGSEK